MRERRSTQFPIARPEGALSPMKVGNGTYMSLIVPDLIPVTVTLKDDQLWAETSPRLRGALLHLRWEWQVSEQRTCQYRIVARLGLSYDELLQEYAFCSIRGFFVPESAKLRYVNILRVDEHILDALQLIIKSADLHWVADRRSDAAELLSLLS